MRCFALPSSRVRLGMTNDGLYRAIVDSKEAGGMFTRKFGTFRTLRHPNGEHTKACLPTKELLKHNVASDFLRAAFSCDGGVNLYVARRKSFSGKTKWLIRGVYLACAHPVLRLQYQMLLKAFGIKSRNVVRDGKIKIETEKDIRIFYQRIGFLKGVHITHFSKFWPNVEKQVLLRRLMQSYESPKDVYLLPQFD
ncbi:MAG: LAGLIDADG family homing endonuclease [Parcubacteria group bacterium]|nr:LAGLIDADG family homing endonuclease [Parcubacteria group bacterium]